MAAGFLSEQRLPEGATGRHGRLGFDDAADGLGGDGGHVHPHRVLGVVAESQVHRVADDVRRHVEEFAVVRRLLRGLPSAPRSCRGSTDERLGLGNVGDAEHRRAGHPGLEDAGGRAAGAVDDRATAVDRREGARPRWSRGRYFSPATEPPSTLTGPATPIGTWIEPTMFSMADSAASAGSRSSRPRRATRRTAIRRAVGAPRRHGVGVGVRFEFVEAEVALPKRGLRGTRRLSCSDVSRAGLKAFCMFFPALSPDSVDNRITAFW